MLNEKSTFIRTVVILNVAYATNIKDKNVYIQLSSNISFHTSPFFLKNRCFFYKPNTLFLFLFRMPNAIKYSVLNLLTNPSLVKESHFFSLSRDAQQRIESKIKQAIAVNIDLNSILKRHGIRLQKMSFNRIDKTDQLDEFIPPQITFIDKTQRQIDEEQKKSNERVQKAKDFVFMSNDSYKDFRRISQLDMPTLYIVKSIQGALNREQLVPNANQHGLYFNCIERIQLILEKKLDKLTLVKPNVLRINIRGDATHVGRNEKFLNFCFNLPDEGRQILIN